jgi:hypothetical protein
VDEIELEPASLSIALRVGTSGVLRQVFNGTRDTELELLELMHQLELHGPGAPAARRQG